MTITSPDLKITAKLDVNKLFDSLTDLMLRPFKGPVGYAAAARWSVCRQPSSCAVRGATQGGSGSPASWPCAPPGSSSSSSPLTIGPKLR